MLIFVYNADTGFFSSMSDFAHKILAPDTYSCNLCKLTYGNLSMKNAWREYLDSLSEEMRFLHRDEFKREFAGCTHPLPAIFRQDDNPDANTEEKTAGLAVILSAEKLAAVESLEQLISLLKEQL